MAALSSRYNANLQIDDILSLADKSLRRDIFAPPVGGIAQLVERLVRNEKARGSNPLTSSFSRVCEKDCY